MQKTNCYAAEMTMSAILYMTELKNGTHKITVQGTNNSCLLIGNFYSYKEIRSNDFIKSVGWSSSDSPQGYHSLTEAKEIKHYASISQKFTHFEIIAIKDPNHRNMEVQLNNNMIWSTCILKLGHIWSMYLLAQRL